MPEQIEPRFYRPITPIPAPQQEPEPELEMEEEQPQESKGGWDWIGSPSRPEAKEHSDGISDLFTVDDEDLDAGEGVDDLVEIDFETDVLDANENGDLEDLTSVDNEDIMGTPPPPRRVRRSARRFGRRASGEDYGTTMGRSG